MSAVLVTNNESEHRYEAYLDGGLAGFAEYQLSDDLIVFTHTEVDPACEGKGIGGAIARHALDDVRQAGDRRVRPQCPFIRDWIGRHPDYLPLVSGAPTPTTGD